MSFKKLICLLLSLALALGLALPALAEGGALEGKLVIFCIPTMFTAAPCPPMAYGAMPPSRR